MSNQKLKSKIYALIIAVTLFVSVNKVTQAEEKSRITETKELADNGNIAVNGEQKKSSYDVKKGDVFDIKYFNKNIKVKVLDLPPESLKKELIDEYIEIIG